jgi:hypothetical protein
MALFAKTYKGMTRFVVLKDFAKTTHFAIYGVFAKPYKDMTRFVAIYGIVCKNI